MDDIQKALLEFNNDRTNLIDSDNINDDTQLMFTLLDMQEFVKFYIDK